MGASESYEQVPNEEEEEEQQQQQYLNVHGERETRRLYEEDENVKKKLLEQEDIVSMKVLVPDPQTSPSASSFSTPRFDPSTQDSLSQITRNFPSESINDDPTITEIYVICHGECHMKLRPDLVGGRCPEAALTPNGKRQARALAVYLKSRGIRFNAVYTSPLDRARATAIPVCQEMDFPEHMIQSSDALQEMSQGLWEGCQRSDVYTPSILNLIDQFQPDFCAPSGETLREVEFRMTQFVNAIVMSSSENLRYDICTPDSNLLTHKYELVARSRPEFPRRKSSKSRLQMVSTSGDHEADDEMSPRVPSNHHELDVFPESSLKSSSKHNNRNDSPSSCCIGVFCHSVPISCLVTGILGCSPTMSTKICIEDSSMTVLQHSPKTGWQIKRLNDTCHLRGCLGLWWEMAFCHFCFSKKQNCLKCVWQKQLFEVYVCVKK